MSCGDYGSKVGSESHHIRAKGDWYERRHENNDARLLMLIAVALGVIGLIAGFAEKEWRLGAVGWFTGSTAVGVLALVILGDAFVEWRQQQGQQ